MPDIISLPVYVLMNQMQDILRSFYHPTVNSFFSAEIFHININIVLLCLFLLVTISFYVGQSVLSRKWPRMFLSPWMFKGLFGIFILYSCCQLPGMHYYFKKGLAFSEKPERERTAALFGDRYLFPEKAREMLPDGCRADLETDLNVSADPGMLHHRVLSYFLYPIDIRGVQDGPKNCMIFFQKEGAAARVPEDYDVLFMYNSENLLAVKKENR